MADDITAIDFYWRQGCGFCMSLNRQVQKWGIPMAKYNIWEDPAHASYVRSVANGSETVPTVRIGEIALVNPSIDDVVAALEVEAPHLVPENYEPRQPGAVGRLMARLLGG